MSGELEKFFSFFLRSFDDFVVNICDVHHLEDIILEVSGHYFSDGVEAEVGLSMTQMRVVVDSWTADVPIDPFSFLRNEFGFFLGPKRVIEHQASSVGMVRNFGRFPVLKFVFHEFINLFHLF